MWGIKEGNIPITLEDARALAALAHSNHLLTVSSWGFARLPPSCISNSDGSKAAALNDK